MTYRSPESPLPQPSIVADASAARDRLRPRPRWLRGLLGWAIYVGVIATAIVAGPRLLAWALDTPYPMAAVTSGSMWPALHKGDLVFLRGVDPEDIEVGDIIAFESDEGFAIHRVVSIDAARRRLQTRGDANAVPDDPVAFEHVLGRVTTIVGRPVRIPYLGNIPMIVRATSD